jgi:hypothetical protein
VIFRRKAAAGIASNVPWVTDTDVPFGVLNLIDKLPADSVSKPRAVKILLRRHLTIARVSHYMLAR